MLRQAAVDEWNMGLSTADIRQRFQVVKFGLNYRFGWGAKSPVVTRTYLKIAGCCRSDINAE